MILLLILGGIMLENKRWAAMLALIPLLIASAVILFAGPYTEFIGGMIIPLLFSVNALMLLAEEIRGNTGMITFLQVIILMIFTAVLGYFSWYGFYFTGQSVTILVLTLISTLSAATCAALVRMILGKHYTLIRLAVYHELSLFAVILVLYMIWMISKFGQWEPLFILPAMITALFVAVPFIPVWVVYTTVPLFRTRINLLLHVPDDKLAPQEAMD